MNRRHRRLLSITFTAGCVALTSSLVQFSRDQMGDESTFTGWTLLAATAGMYLLSLRKKLITWNLGPVAGWLQMHTYMGSFASIVFLMHIGWPVRGWFESGLAACFVIVAFSGIALAWMCRTTPRRLSTLAADYQFDRIPALQAIVARDAHHTALKSSRLGEGATLSEYYQRELLPFFQNPRGWFYCLMPNGILRRKLIRELNDLDRYLGAEGIESRQGLVTMVKSKDDLDYHYALQSRLRWLFSLHVLLTWALAIMVCVHVVLVYRFQAAL